MLDRFDRETNLFSYSKKYLRSRQRSSIDCSERDERILVRNSPVAENARSASVDVGGRLRTAQKTFSMQAGRSSVLSKTLISFFKIPADDEKFCF